MKRVATYSVGLVCGFVLHREEQALSNMDSWWFLPTEITKNLGVSQQIAVSSTCVKPEFDTRKELLSLSAMHSVTKVQDLFEQVVLAKTNQ